MLEDIWLWLSDVHNWQGPAAIPTRVGEHLTYTAIAVFLAALIALPIGTYIGHTGRYRNLALGITGSLRAMPTLGLLTLIVLLAGIGLTAPIIALAILCIPPLL
ncbi:MAG: ABC transporter permease, partial [Bowdeniella nasicola]|nr:ABC transporter permease [Bowdeniella nasicola]